MYFMRAIDGHVVNEYIKITDNIFGAKVEHWNWATDFFLCKTIHLEF